MRKVVEIIGLVLFTLSMTACPGKNDSNGSAATPKKSSTTTTTASVDCQWSWQAYAYVDKNNNTCTPDADDLNNTNYCHNYVYNWNTNKWVDKKGKPVNCVEGYIDFSNIMPYQIYYGSFQANCSVYGYGWYPMQFGSSLVCVKQSFVNYYFPNYYYPQSSYYYPTACRYGVDCFSACGGISGGGQSHGLWFGGTLGLCI